MALREVGEVLMALSRLKQMLKLERRFEDFEGWRGAVFASETVRDCHKVLQCLLSVAGARGRCSRPCSCATLSFGVPSRKVCSI